MFEGGCCPGSRCSGAFVWRANVGTTLRLACCNNTFDERDFITMWHKLTCRRQINAVFDELAKCYLIKGHLVQELLFGQTRTRPIALRGPQSGRLMIINTALQPKTVVSTRQIRSKTRSSAIAEGPRDASCQLKSCQLPRNKAETTYTTSPDQTDGMKLDI